MSTVFSAEVVIRREIEVEKLVSGQEVSLGRFDLSQLKSEASDFQVMVDYQSLAMESIRNPTYQGFDLQFWFSTEVCIIGRQGDDVVFEISSGQYDVVNVFESVSAESTRLLSFPDLRSFQCPVPDVSTFADGEIELFFKLRQTLSGGTEELSTLQGYREISMKVELGFTTALIPRPTPDLLLHAKFNGPGDGVLNFLTRQGFLYQIHRAGANKEVNVVLSVEGTGTDLTYSLADLKVTESSAMFWLEELALPLSGD